MKNIKVSKKIPCYCLTLLSTVLILASSSAAAESPEYTTKDTTSIILRFYYDDYLNRLYSINNNEKKIPDFDKIRDLSKKSIKQLLTINDHDPVNLCFVKYEIIEEEWLKFDQENREQYLQKLEAQGVDTSIVSKHKVDMENLKNAIGLDFFGKLAQKWEDIDETRKIYQQVYRRKR